MSTPIEDGGPAFPVQSIYSEDHGTNSRGISVRDYFAGQALAGMVTRPPSGAEFSDYAVQAYFFADAMLAERELQP